MGHVRLTFLARLAQHLEHRGHAVDQAVALPDDAVAVEDEDVHRVEQLRRHLELLAQARLRHRNPSLGLAATRDGPEGVCGHAGHRVRGPAREARRAERVAGGERRQESHEATEHRVRRVRRSAELASLGRNFYGSFLYE